MEVLEVQVGKLKPIQYYVDDKGCFICISHCRTQDGYPRCKVNGKGTRIGRYLYALEFGEIPKDIVVRHKCDNPHCINVTHLELGTVGENVLDRDIRGRSGSAKLTENQVKDIFYDSRPQKLISEEYGLAGGVVSRIKTGSSWKHLGLIKRGD